MYLTRFRFNTARTEARRLLGSPHRLHGAVNMAFPEPPPRDGDAPRVLWRLDQAPTGRVDLLVSSPARPDLTHLVEQAGWPSLGAEGWTTFAYAEFLDALAEGDVWAFRLTANPVHHVRRDSDAPGTPTKRTAHVTPRHQIGWLLKHQERAGFAVLRSPARAVEETVLAGPRDAAASGTTGAGPAPGAGTAVAPAGAADEAAAQGPYELVVHDRTPVRFGKPSGGPDAAALTRGRHAPGGRDLDVRFARATFDGKLRITDLTAFRRTLTHGLGKAKAYGCGLMTLAPVR
ncbi:type I-E CRISPR-associated protein Cas6/Cse3/CasE [Streptomyces sp. NPDC014748]|uniref:type I-E CRISPR-associated protein Cas6/Cse3/CasE n=1 Tax=Streptomyces sp. NPDC014748 TaxID=3364905 RepID=UPI0036F60AD7